ncbi:MAG: phosphoadenosine phosphosulfate reductase family protein [Deltaproteobacteria bacterium]|nr:phosphoadenosine phosphosulfate reductase family protein [Candidatus Anaeroferrophillus wilburensis]MBN2889852.1 phosphoadenosine phosphosulfate reductase family protein [Deltaproteobacteria bacterium]
MSRIRYRGTLRRVRAKVGKALADYAMTADGDRLMVAVSGGKDSLALLHILETRKQWIPVTYYLEPVFVSLGEPEDQQRLTVLETIVSSLNLHLQVVKTDIGYRLRHEPLTEHVCFHCSRWKRQALFNHAREQGISKIVFGHHRDDILETALLNLFYGSNFSTMVPHQRLFNNAVSLIRPLAYLDETDVIAYCVHHNLPANQPPCPLSGDNQKRMLVRDLLKRLQADNPRVKDSIFHALGNVRRDYLLDVGRHR